MDYIGLMGLTKPGIPHVTRSSKAVLRLSATAYQALTARFIANLAREVNRKDLESYFLEEHHTLDKLVNQYFWDEQHQIYNDLNKDGKFITEIEPGTYCKHCHIFWPLIAGIAHNERATGMVAEI